MVKQTSYRIKKTLVTLLLISVLINLCVGTAYAGSYDWMEKYLGRSTVDTMNRAERNMMQNSANNGMGNGVNNWMVRNSGGYYVSGPYDWMRPYLGDATVNYMNARQNDPTPYWANADTRKMTPMWASKYNAAKASAEYYHNKRWSNLGRY